ncbi:M28 family peptidase [Candidatus Sumerlaeota bacterium]
MNEMGEMGEMDRMDEMGRMDRVGRMDGVGWLLALMFALLLAPVAPVAAAGADGATTPAAKVSSAAAGPGQLLVAAAKAFDGYRAHQHIVEQCRFGPRLAGYPGHRQGRDYIVNHLKKLGWKTELQKFDAYSAVLRKSLSCENIIARLDTPATQTIVLSCHWDTRPIADRDPDRSLRRSPIPGANDGGSGVAVLLELATAFAKHPPPYDLVFLFFDAEDMGLPRTDRGWCLGSRHFVDQRPKDLKFLVGVNIDMVADGDQLFQIEPNSLRTGARYVKELWSVGIELYPENFSLRKTGAITDDHLAFVEEGLPYLNIIDLDYKQWHTTADLPGKCVPKSLTRIGRTVAQWLVTRGEKEKKIIP